MSVQAGKICIVCHREFPHEIKECPVDLVLLTEKDARIGSIFDEKYEILDFVGAGGLSRVYKALHKGLNRVIALKILKSSDLIDLKRFRREAVSVGQLEHPNIARVYSFSVSPEGSPYMAQEFLDGIDLAEKLARYGPLDPLEAVRIFLQVAEALVHAHSRKIIHRDIKPGNIMLLPGPDQFGTVKVVDFGMAKLYLESSGEQQKITQEGEIFGTRQYISPEQYKGMEADERADVYSFGVSMFEAVLKDGKIPDQLRGIIASATQSDPLLRTQSFEQIRDELKELQETLSASSIYYVASINAAAKEPKKDLFSTFYLWIMLGGMLVVGVSAVVVIKERIARLEASSQQSLLRTSHSRVAPLGFEATQNQAESLASTGQLKDAVQLYLQWLRRKAHNEKTWRQEIWAHYELSLLYSRLGNLDAAVNSARNALNLCKKQAGSAGSTEIRILTQMAALEYLKENLDRSIEFSKRALALARAENSKAELDSEIVSQYNLARCFLVQDKLDEAEKQTKAALERSVSYYGVLSFSASEGYDLLAAIYAERKNYPAAIEYAVKAVDCYQTNSSSVDIGYLNSISNKAALKLKSGDRAGALTDYRYVNDRLAKAKHTNPYLEDQIRAKLKQLDLELKSSETSQK